jgi:hypothetical protein
MATDKFFDGTSSLLNYSSRPKLQSYIIKLSARLASLELPEQQEAAEQLADQTVRNQHGELLGRR